MFTTEVNLIGNHPKFVKAIELANNLAVTKAPVLIVGETGTGKKTFCHYIHQNSSRKKSQISIVDCAQDAKSVENQILGFRDQESGRFNKGVLESSNGGTVIFANIDALEESFQKRLFTILQELVDYDLDIRVMATTSKNLSKYVGAGRFHRALFTYFSNAQINLIPLRERGTDIELLSIEIAKKWSIENESDMFEFSQEAFQKIASFYWTHNIAELIAVIENALANCEGTIVDVSAIELGEKKVEAITNDQTEDGLKLMSLKDAEKLLIKKALIHTSENRTQAAKILGVSIRTLRNKINEYRSEGNNYFVNLR